MNDKELDGDIQIAQCGVCWLNCGWMAKKVKCPESDITVPVEQWQELLVMIHNEIREGAKTADQTGRRSLAPSCLIVAPAMVLFSKERRRHSGSCPGGKRKTNAERVKTVDRSLVKDCKVGERREPLSRCIKLSLTASSPGLKSVCS